RHANGKFVCSNEEVEQTITGALEHGCRKLDLFFMVGIPGQSPASAMAIADYCEHLIERFHADPRLHFFVAPLGPFLDPGSRAFEDPSLGYTQRFTTLEEHRQALLQPSWRDVLSYESDAMTRDQIVETSYALAERLNQLKFDNRLIDEAAYHLVSSHLTIARDAIEVMGQSSQADEHQEADALAQVQKALGAANTGSMNSKDELKWAPSGGFRVSTTLLRGLAWGLLHEVAQTGRRLTGRYDRVVYQAEAPAPPLETVAVLPK
ncbi:MAG TPA: hypothetical protein VGR61_06030, partial [Candidatus Dormibacteraeota bacterium]|nr:hypothetical protein [Candidatus Dormibacteraeota bacterium]